MLADGIRARGSFHRLNHDAAVRHAARPTPDIVAELRTHADSRRLPAVTNYRNILFDVLVHTQDIAIPLGRDVSDAAGGCPGWGHPSVDHGMAVLGAPPAPRCAAARH